MKGKIHLSTPDDSPHIVSKYFRLIDSIVSCWTALAQTENMVENTIPDQSWSAVRNFCILVIQVVGVGCDCDLEFFELDVFCIDRVQLGE